MVESAEIECVPFPLKDAGVDWITVTCRAGDTQSAFDEVGYSLLHVESDGGSQLKPWSFEQFEGLNAGKVAFGKRDDLSLLRLSSGAAWSYWRRAFELSTNCSRIDFQVTIRDVPEPDALILASHELALAHSNKRRRPVEVDLRLSNRRGPTLYLGMRESARFGRLYNKFRESRLDHYAGCVRAELQVNGKAANFAGRVLLEQKRDPHSVIPYVTGFFLNRGIRPYWPTIASHHLSVPRRRTNAERRLSWLRSQVGPAVRSLVEAGYLTATLDALGLSEFVEADMDQMVHNPIQEE